MQGGIYGPPPSSWLAPRPRRQTLGWKLAQVILGQRGRERATHRIASHGQQYHYRSTKRPAHIPGGQSLDQKLAKSPSRTTNEAERGTDDSEQEQHSRRTSNL